MQLPHEIVDKMEGCEISTISSPKLCRPLSQPSTYQLILIESDVLEQKPAKTALQDRR